MPNSVALLVPRINPNDDSAVLACWHVASGTRVSRDQVLVTLETTKTAFDLNAPREGVVLYECEPSSIVTVGAAIAWIADDEKAARVLAAGNETASEDQVHSCAVEPRITRKAARLMRQQGLSLVDLPAQRQVSVADVQRVAHERLHKTQVESLPSAARLEQSAAKILEVQALSAAHRQVIPSSVCVPVCCKKTQMRLRDLNEEVGPISLLELAVYELARLLVAYPQFNGFYDEGRAWQHQTVAIGVALNFGRGLRVPVVRDAVSLSLLAVVRQVRDLALKYARGELDVCDLTGGTCTVTDLSSHGVTHFSPVLNQRQSAILGLCAEQPGTGHRDLVLAFDHRMADGMDAAVLLGELRAHLETGPAC
jgi:2-oxoglutarate dehydrogenase E2 component (dihydrolipoamide succinyltransferase)